MNITDVKRAMEMEGKRLIPPLEPYELKHILKRFRSYCGSMSEEDAFMQALKDIPRVETRSLNWAQSK